jgi:hypothetical protein
MLRREREEGYGSCDCGDRRVHGAVLRVVWRVRELEYYWRS